MHSALSHSSPRSSLAVPTKKNVVGRFTVVCSRLRKFPLNWSGTLVARTIHHVLDMKVFNQYLNCECPFDVVYPTSILERLGYRRSLGSTLGYSLEWLCTSSAKVWAIQLVQCKISSPFPTIASTTMLARV